ncbi:MAG: hypothetical protein Q8O38_04415 [Sulfurimicrobium sp.]|nr:hypothetical protein [Sulfurimicrobium sp.]
MGKSSFKTRVILFFAALLLCGMAGVSNAEDELNCVLCHKHRGLSRIDENGNFRLFYINEALFEEGPHVRVKCMDCHRDISKIPHDPAKKVDCTTECHLTEPSGQKKFSHKPVSDMLAKSVHGKLDADGSAKEHQQDYPGCKDCHEEPLYRPLSFFKGKTSGVSERSLSRCKTCHTTGKFAESFYKHVTSRLQKSRKPAETVGVCAKCHGDKEFQQRHKLDDVVTSYKETYHWKAIRFGSEETPDCVDCHVVKGEGVHFIEGKDSPTSASNKKNVPTTCRTSECHEKASANLADFQVHVTYDKDKYPLQHYMLVFFTWLMAGVLYFFLILIILELLRRLFPNFSFKKSPDDDRHSSK